MDLYKITFQGLVATYTSSEFSVELFDYTFIPSAITRTEISLELTNAEVRLDLPQDTYPFKYFVLSSPSSEVEITIYDYSSGFEIFRGIVTKVNFNRSKQNVTATLKRKEAFFDSEVPYRTYGTSCSFLLYDQHCGVNMTSHIINSSVFTLSNIRDSISSPDLLTVTSGTFTGGSIETNLGETSFILSHAGGTVVLTTPLISIPSVVTFIKGCNKSTNECTSKFNNIINFGGFPFIPSKNPVTESI
ncbi:MAG: phage BR0599 family protein [Ignisphaera sp.]|nr:phage BR0599 family protein [Ignisphaera sp.]